MAASQDTSQLHQSALAAVNVRLEAAVAVREVAEREARVAVTESASDKVQAQVDRKAREQTLLDSQQLAVAHTAATAQVCQCFGHFGCS